MKPWKKFMSLVLASSMIITLPAVTSAAEFEATVYDVSDDSGSEAIENENTDTDAASFSGNDDAASQNQTLDFGDGQSDSEETDFSSGDQEFVADESEFADAAGAISISGKPADGITENQPFISNTTGGSANFRIPAMVTLSDGTIVAATDARWNTTSDGFGLDTVVSRSSDGGATWNYTFANYLGDNENMSNSSSTAFIDPALAVDSNNTIYMLVDLFPAGGYIGNISYGKGYDDSGRLKLTTETNPSDKSTYGYYLDGDKIYDNSGNAVSGLTVDKYFNVTGTYNDTDIDTNLFFSDSPFKVLKTSYLYLTKSTDKGATWSEPIMLNSQVKDNNETFYGVGPGRGLVTKLDSGAERIIFPCYTHDKYGVEKTSVIYSDDGINWKRSGSMTSQSSEATLVEAGGRIYMFTRGGGYYVSENHGETWSGKKDVTTSEDVKSSYNSDCQINAITYSKEIDGHQAILLSAPSSTSSRANGMIFVGLIQEDGSIQWKYKYAVNNGTYQYSCMTELKDGSIALLYENGAASEYFVKYSLATILGQKDSTLTDEETGVKVHFTEENVQSMTVSATTVDSLDGKAYVAYDVVPGTGYNKTSAEVTIPLAVLANKEKLKAFYVDNGEVKYLDGTKSDNNFVFTVPHFTVVGVVEAASDVTTPDTSIPDNGTDNTVNVSLRIGETQTFTQDGVVTGDFSNDFVQANATEVSSEYYESTTLSANNSFYVSSSAGSTSPETQLAFEDAGNGQYYVKNASDSYVYPNATYSLYPWNWGWSYSLATGKQAVDITQNSNGSIVISKKVSSTTSYLSVNGSSLSASSNSSSVYLYNKKDQQETSVTLKGLAAGTTSVTIGNTTYNITVKEIQEATLKNGPFVSKTTDTEGKVVTKLTISQGQSYSLGVNKTGTVTWSIKDGDIATVDQNGKVKALKEGETVLYATINGVVYSMPIVVPKYTDSTSVKTYHFYASEIKDTTAYYGVLNGSNNNNVQAYDLYKLQEGEVLYLAFANDAGTAVDFFGSPNDGYALTQMSATDSAGHYMALDSSNPESTGFITEKGKAGAIQVNTYGLAPVYNLVSKALNTNPKCDGGMGFTRASDNSGNVTSSLTFRSEKLPTVEKKVTSVTRHDTNKEETYKEGMVARVGDIIHFAVTVKKYACSDDNNVITYDNVKLQENLSGAYFEDDNKTSKTIKIAGNASEKTYTYKVAYKVTENDLDNTIINTVNLTYNYKARYSTGSFNGTANAKAKIVASNFPGIKDLVIDFGLPVSVKVNPWDSAAGSIVNDMTGTARIGKEKVGTVDVKKLVDDDKKGYNQTGIEVTYTPDTILTDVVTVTLTAKSGNKSAPYSFNIYPATTVYYEEGFANYEGNWATYNNKGIGNQTPSVAGEHQSHYGYEQAYAKENSGPSNGTQAVSSSVGDSAKLKFTGTGIDIYANGDTNTGAAGILIVRDENGSVVKLIHVNTQTGNGGTATQNQNRPSFNQPIVSLTGLDYGKYTVTIKHSHWNANETQSGVLNLDGFRIYGTLKDEATNPVYKGDREENPSYVELRDKVLTAIRLKYKKDLSLSPGDAKNQIHAALSGEAAGATAIVLSDNQNITYANDLLENGPKNEIYLRPGESLTFNLSTTRIAQIGLKALTGRTMYNLTVGDGQGETKPITSSTDMFYKLCDAKQTNTPVNVTITNKGANNDNKGDQILAITKLKICDDPSATLTALSEKDLEVALDDLGLSEKENPTPTPTESPKPSEAPVPTESPKPSEAPVPTESPKPSETPVPTETPKPSETPEATPTPTKEPEKPVKLSTPKLGKVVSVSYNSVKVTWNKVKDADGYRVYMKQNGKWKSLGKVDSNSYTCKGLKTGKKYTFTVRAYKNTKDGVVLSAYDKKGISGTPKLSTPVLKSAKRSASGVTFTWKKTAGANGYVVYRKANNGAWRAAAKVTKGTIYKDTTAKKGVKYTYTVRALRKSGATSVYSDYNAKGISVK